MFEDESLKLRLYLWPIICFALGTVAALNPGWEWFGLAMYLLGFVIMTHLIIVSVIRERRMFIDADADRLKKQNDLYQTVMNMDNEARYAFGLSYTPLEVKVKVDKTKVEGNEFSQTWRKLPVAPYKLKVIAQATINGEDFTVRKWAGDGKLLSREEWDALHKSMVDLGMLEMRGKVPQEGYMWTALGEDVMRQVLLDTL